jgi:Copper transport outer membrane protein, MctB
MGYSGRYHAASLAAVFLALAIGILIGVGLGDNVLSGAQRDLEQSLKSDLADTRGHNQALQGELNSEREFSEQIYPALVPNLLSGKRVALVALGGLPEGIKGDIEAVVGGGSPTAAQLAEVAVVHEPPDLHALAGAAKDTRWRRVARDPDALSALARRLGEGLVAGGPTLARFRDSLLSGISGRPGRIDAVILVRNRPPDLGPGQSQAADGLEAGIVAGLQRSGGVPVVGVERSDTDPSSIGFYSSSGLRATVDSVDLVSGRVALAYALAGAEGNYGTKPTADRLLPALGQPAAPRRSGSSSR